MSERTEVATMPRMDAEELVMGVTKKEFTALAESILITILHRPSDGIHPRLSVAQGKWEMAGCHVEPVEDQFGGCIDVTRANMARQFLAYCIAHPEVNKHVMIDNDEAVPIEAPFKLALWNRPVVSGVVCSYNENRGIFACFTVKDKYGAPRFPSIKYTSKLPRRGLLKAYSLGTGLLCVQKGVYETIIDGGENPFEIPQKVRERAFISGVLKDGEDTSFSKQCERFGFDRWVDLSVHAVHYKNVGICWPITQFDDDMTPDDFQIDVRDYLHG